MVTTRTLDQYIPNPRLMKAEVIASIGGNVKRVKAEVFVVKSQTGVGVYRVDSLDGWKCNCPDHITRLLDCKHIMAVRLHLARLEAPPVEVKVSSGMVGSPQNGTKRDWSKYNMAQVKEWELFGEMLHDLCATIEEPEQHMGRPRLSMATRVFCSVLKVYSQQSSRRSHGLYSKCVENELIDRAPHFNMASKFFMTEDATPILRELVRESALPLAGIERDFAVDASGFRTNTFSAWHGQKHGERKQHRWLKAHIISGRLTNIVADVVITPSIGKGTGDVSNFIPLVEATADGFKVDEISADKAYLSKANMTAVDDIGAVPYIPFKANSRSLSRGCPTWKKMFYYFQLHREEWEEHYHKRSNVETSFFAIKQKFGECLKSKNEVAQINELLAKFLAYNITCLIRAMHEHGVSVDSLAGGA